MPWLAERLGFDLVVAKGSESGGIVGEETTFVLLQHLAGSSKGARRRLGWSGPEWHGGLRRGEERRVFSWTGNCLSLANAAFRSVFVGGSPPWTRPRVSW